jgi:lipoprotein-releasing system permease protein
MDAWALLLRYLKTRRAAWVACLCIMLAVAAMIVVTSVMDGFRARIQGQIRGTEPDLAIRWPTPLPRDHESRIREELAAEMATQGGPIISLAPRLESVALVLAGNSRVPSEGTTFSTLGVRLLGVEWKSEKTILPWERLIEDVQDPALAAPLPIADEVLFGPIPGIIIGRALADSLGIQRVEGAGFGVADQANLLTGRVVQNAGRDREFEPSNLLFRVVAVFDSGRDDFDLSHAFVSREAFRRLRYGEDRSRPDASVVHARVREELTHSLDEVVAGLKQRHPELLIETWAERNRGLVDALRIEKTTMTVILGFIVFLSVALVLGLLVMMVLEKTRDIGIARSLGMSRTRVLWAFAGYGAILGFVGAVLGAILGVGLVGDLNSIVRFIGDHLGIEIFSSDVAYKSREIPAVLDYRQVGFIAAFSFFLAASASALVAIRAARVDPVFALQKD